MKVCYDLNGNDNTATAKQVLLQNRQLLFADLYALGPASTSGGSRSALAWVGNQSVPIRSTFLATNQSGIRPQLGAPGAISTGMFLPRYTKRSNIEYRLGTEVSELQLEIGTMDNQAALIGSSSVPYQYTESHQDYGMMLGTFGATQMLVTFKQLLANGEFQGWPFWFFRGIMPTLGDVDTIGVVPMFFGWLASYEITRSKITLKIQSPLSAFVQPYPLQTIDPGDRRYNFRAKSNISYFPTPTTGTTTSVIVGTGGANLIPAGLLNDGWVVFHYGGVTIPGGLKFIRRIRTNIQQGGLNYIYLYQPLPYQPLLSSDSMSLFAASSLDSVGSTIPG